MRRGMDARGNMIRSFFGAGKASQLLLYSRGLCPVSGREWRVTDAGGMSGMRFSAEGIRHDDGVLQQKGN